MSIIATRTAEYLIVEAHFPGQAPVPAGVLLHDPERGLLKWRFRQDWSEVAAPEDAEVLDHLSDMFGEAVEERGPEGFLEWAEGTFSNTIRLSGREAVLIANFDSTLRRLYNQHVRPVEPFVTHWPVFTLRAAAGSWGEDASVEADDWIEAPPGARLTRDHFVAHVVGRSMEPVIPDGSLCLFRRGVAGSRQGKKVLVENLAESEAGGQRYTVKVFRSEKRRDAGSWEHEVIRFEPLNPEFQAWEITDQHQCRVIAEFVRVLE
jgi:hypothetical protein